MQDFNFNDLATYVAVVQTSSFSRAARELGSTKSATSKQVAKLEAALNGKLLNRSTRQLSMTELGRTVFEHGQRVLEQTKLISQAAAGLQSDPRGVLKISTTVALASTQVSVLLPEFLRRYPEVQVNVSVNDRFVNVAEEGFDLLLRLTSSLSQQSVVARPIAPVRYALVASPSYVQMYGVPADIESIAAHRCLAFSENPAPVAWSFRRDGETIGVKVHPCCAINSSLALRLGVLGAAGIAVLPTFVVGQDICAGSLVRVLPDYEPVGMFGDTLFAVYPENRYLAPKVRVFIDYLVEKIGADPYWDCF